MNVSQCVCCCQFFFKEEEFVAFQARDKTIDIINLDGRGPWSGVRAICKHCVQILKGSLA